MPEAVHLADLLRIWVRPGVRFTPSPQIFKGQRGLSGCCQKTRAPLSEHAHSSSALPFNEKRVSSLELLPASLGSLASPQDATISKFKENEDAQQLNLIRIQEELNILQENFTVVQQNVTQLKNESSALNENYKELQLNITELENYNKKLQSNITELEKTNNELQSSHVKLHATISSLNKSHTELTLRFRALDEFCPVTNQLTQARKCSFCPNKWLQSKGNCYYFSTDKLNWNDSRSNCRSMNGHLVIIESKEEQ
ncbi:low affinity immunoglobulin epsilon Fc receptor-like, partial [Polypterus senegalus]|uniref:low affinity immunoglobulin epsilon Fc receptor-like n=1 Tax=Polypterus senegalus TaxID=55291 RepID=UPI0019669637